MNSDVNASSRGTALHAACLE
ncbi:hypothetical protein CEXT_408911, partial [Caerostris extrusa]